MRDAENTIITTDYGDGVLLDEYKDTYGLVATRKGDSDVSYVQWCFLSEWKNGEGKPSGMKRPISVRLGDKATAIATLQRLLTELGGVVAVTPEDDIPF